MKVVVASVTNPCDANVPVVVAFEKIPVEGVTVPMGVLLREPACRLPVPVAEVNVSPWSEETPVVTCSAVPAPVNAAMPVTPRFVVVALVVVALVKIAVEGVEAPIVVLLIAPPVMVAFEEEKRFAVNWPETVVVANMLTPCAAKVPVEVAAENTPVEGVALPIAVALIDPPPRDTLFAEN